MASKVFVSYRYRDAREYVDKIEEIFKRGNNIYKDEKNNEDLSGKTDEYIKNKIKDKIFDTTVTIVLISENTIYSKWIPWEISYSLQEIVRSDNRSRTNGVVAIVLPDSNLLYKSTLSTKYSWAKDIYKNWNKNLFPELIFKNTNNLKNNHSSYINDKDYISIYTWDEFEKKYDEIIEEAKNKNQAAYNLTKYN